MEKIMFTNTSNEPRKIAVPKYFHRTPERPTPPSNALYIGLAIAGISFVALFAGEWWAICGGILGILVGGGLAVGGWGEIAFYNKALKQYEEEYKAAEPKPSDKQIDEWLKEDIEKLIQNALRELDLDPEQLQQDPIVVVGPSNTASLAIGKDGVVRYSKYDVVIVFLTEYHLAAYTATINMATGTTLRESTQEYHYTDIVSVSTRTESSKKFVLVFQGENKKLPVYKEFSLSVASGDHIRVVTPFDSPEFLELFESEGEVEIKIPETGADKAVRLIRARLREKKGGAQV